MDIADSIIHEARKDRTTYAAAILLQFASEQTGLAAKYAVERAVDLAIDIEREVNRRLDEELKRGNKK